jgi:putative peptide zinc metalloprotease protein
MSDAALSASGGALPLRRRTDLEFAPAAGGDLGREAVKDPISLRYFELCREEAFLLRQFDGATSRETIRRRFERRFAPRRFDAEQLDRFAAQLYRQGLLTTDRAGQGPVLLERARTQRRDYWRRKLLNPWAIAIPGIDPRPILDRLTPLVGWIFTRAFVVATALLIAAASATAVIHAPQLSDEISVFAGSLTLDGLLIAAAVVAGAKVVHELAHAVACRRFGGECREIGVLLLMGVPALYCDVTGIWMVRERRKRMIVGAAGMLAEIVLASIAILLWNASEPGLFHSLCLQTAVVCSVATVVFNGNPLLRYDGYFILSDLTGVSNLGEQADAALRDRLERWFFGSPPTSDDRIATERRRAWLPWYAAASQLYKLVVMFGLVWFVRTLLEPRGLLFLADLIGVVVFAAVVVPPTMRTGTRVRERLRSDEVDRRRFGLRGAACALVVGAVLFWPWSYRVAAPAIVRCRGAQPIIVTTPGRLVAAAKEGNEVKAQGIVAKLENLEIERELTRLAGEQAQAMQTIAGLEARRRSDPAAGEELPTAQKMLEAITQRLKLRQAEAEQLTLRAPSAGMVFAVPTADATHRRNDAETSADSAPETYDSPLEPRRLGRFVEPGTVLCIVGDPRHSEAVLVADEREIEFVRKGDRVRLQFDAAGVEAFEGRVEKVAEQTLDVAPQELMIAGLLPSRVDQAGDRRTTSTYFQVRVTLELDGRKLPLDAIGQAKIDTAPQSLAQRGLRWLSGTFRLPAAEQ